MILTSVMEYAASPRRLYSVLSDFEALEQIARQYGAAITTQSPGDAQGQGRIWQMQITARGMSRKVTARVANVVPPGSFQVIGESDGVMADLRVSIAPGVEKRPGPRSPRRSVRAGWGRSCCCNPCAWPMGPWRQNSMTGSCP